VFTPNDRFYVRWHWASIPTEVDAGTFRLKVHGHVEKELSLSLDAIAGLPRFEIAAVNQCSGNSRGLFEPRVPGAQWANGSMGNAKWTGVRLKDVLEQAGVKAGAVQVRFDGLDAPVVDDAPDFKKSLDLDHASNGEVMIAYAMNGEQLPLLNGFPLRLVVPGWYSTYWVKMLSDIEVLDKPDEQYWMKTAYRIPDVPGANIKPGQTGFKTVPINRMVPRSFVTNLQDGARVAAGTPVAIRGIAFGGDCGVKTVEVSGDGGATWVPAQLGADEGPYSFRRFDGSLPALAAGTHTVKVRCTNTKGVAQGMDRVWNANGFMQNGIETVSFQAA
jgi:DMSO/TMAO reductase YedYZ molybdopterin-dependent catalytic subunit